MFYGLWVKKLTLNKLSWEDAYKEMGRAEEDWDDWDHSAGDGLE